MSNTPHFHQKIIIDVTHIVRNFLLNRRPTGVRRVGLAYIAHYRHHALALYKNRVFTRAQSDQLFTAILQGETGASRPTTSRGLSAGSRDGSKFVVRLALWRSFLTHLFLKKPVGGLLLNPSFDGLDKPWYSSLLTALKVRPVFIVYDLIPMTHPEYCVDIAKSRHTMRTDRMLDLASATICISTATASELMHYASQSNQRLPPTTIAPLASAMSLHLPGERLISEPYFVILGTIEPRKNHALLLQIWRDLATQLGEKAPKLIIIGQRGWKCEHVTNLLDYSPLLKGLVIERSDCSDSELTTYLHHAQALLFPSLIEGYGLPLAEALTLNVPVIASDLPVFREIAGDIPDYVHPLDGKRWGELIRAYTEPKSTSRKEQLLRMEGFKAPTWAEHFSKVDAFLNEL
ncbi:MAG: glycosyltransferase family 1 protein [Gammaproteobacteria bacterium]|nr:glycosyltransferase family 1 protein [Gammaproteobacteria bacterium]